MDAPSKPRPKLLAALRKASSDSSDNDSGSESDASDSGIGSPAPSTNVKSTSLLEPQSTSGPVDDDEDSDGDAAYERMKQRLAVTKANAVQKDAHAIATTEVSQDDEEEEDMPVRPKPQTLAMGRTKSISPRKPPTPRQQSRQSSPGLFVTPDPSPVKKKPSRVVNDDTESDGSSRPVNNTDLQERVQRIRAERLAKRQKEDLESAVKGAKRHGREESGSESDGENGRKLTQHAKPTRKAGKKAMEAMARDQQRISRNMQLTHQAKTKKRFTTKDLLTKFGFPIPDDGVSSIPTPQASSAIVSSDVEALQLQETPPTSPPRPVGQDVEPGPQHPVVAPTAFGTKQPVSVTSAAITTTEGKERASDSASVAVHSGLEQHNSIMVQNAMVELSDSEEDEQVQVPKSRFPVFDRLPTKQENESASLLRLRALAQISKSPKRGKKGQKNVSLAEMEFSLGQKARQQAQAARKEKIDDLIRRGHHIETEEEREQRQVEIEDLVAQMEKQREDDLRLAKREKADAKKNGETVDDLPSSDDEDGDYVGSGDEQATNDNDAGDDVAELELSGSEDEKDDTEQSEEEDGEEPLIDTMASEEDDTNVTSQNPLPTADIDMEDEEASLPPRKQPTRRPRNIIVDEDDEDDSTIRAPEPAMQTQPTTQGDAMAAFGFGGANAGVGLTQMFAGTMAELDSGSQADSAAVPDQEQNSLDFLRGLPDTQPGANFSQASDFMIPNSQSLVSPRKESQIGADADFSLGISQLVKTSPGFSRTQIEDFEPTQDAGFSFSRSPAGLAPPPSTTDTIMMPVAETPVKQRKGKLQRGRREAAADLSDVEEGFALVEEGLGEDESDSQLPPKLKDAFSKLQKGAKKQKVIDDFNKKTSMAKDAVMEQAEESEDEYAGLGGASDDDEGEEDEDLKDMIDHNKVDVDEREIAAFYADKEKKDDAKNIAELYKKIQTGGLRRHAGGPGFDMSDSEDESEMRQRKKRAEFQKQTNELLKDERVKEISKDEKKKAFFNTLADFADEGDYDFLDMPAELNGPEQSQSQEETRGDEIVEDIIPDSQNEEVSAHTNPLKRKSPEVQKENRPPPNLRRTAASEAFTRKPITMEDIQNSVSELLEDSRVVVPDSQYSDQEDDEEPYIPSRKGSIIDRLSLSRSSTVEEGAASDGTMAFHAPSRTVAVPGFRVPSLIRQATSNLSTTSQRSSGTKTPTEGVVRRGGTGRSNIHAQAREAERRALLDKKESKRKEALRKKVEGGRKRAGGMRSVLGDLGGGFE